MQKIIKFSLFTLLLLAFSLQSHAQDRKMTKEEKKTMKTLKKTVWQTRDGSGIEKDGRPIDFNNITGAAYMHFYDMKEKQKGSKRKVKVNKWKMEIGGQERVFNYTIKGDSIAFDGVKGWNDMRIITLEKDRLTVDQLSDGSIIRWNMVPKKKED
jgi:hypothetical protein